MKQFVCIFFLLVLLGCTKLFGQDEQILVNPEVHPEFPEGQEALFVFIVKNLQLPKDTDPMLSKIYFTIEIDTLGVPHFGSILKLSEGGNQAGIAQELNRIIQLMPKWKPGTQSGIKVPMKMTIPLRVHLE